MQPTGHTRSADIFELWTDLLQQYKVKRVFLVSLAMSLSLFTICMYVCMYVCMCACMYAYVCMHMYVCICMYAYVYIKPMYTRNWKNKTNPSGIVEKLPSTAEFFTRWTPTPQKPPFSSVQDTFGSIPEGVLRFLEIVGKQEPDSLLCTDCWLYIYIYICIWQSVAGILLRHVQCKLFFSRE